MEFLVLLIGVVFIVIAVALLKLHPFLALILAGFLVGILSPVPLDLDERVERARAELEWMVQRGEIDQAEMQSRLGSVEGEIRQEAGGPSQAVLALETTAREFGGTAAGIGIVIVLAAIIGQCLMESGAADRIVRRFLQLLGEKRAAVSLMGSGYFLSVPVFFDTVFFLLIPLARALRVRTRKDYVLYVMAISGGAIVSHSLVPPTPGPLIMVENFGELGLDLGTALAAGVLLGIFPAFGGLLFARSMNRRLPIPFREVLGSTREELETQVGRPDDALPPFWLSVLPVLLPVLLIAGHTTLETLERQGLMFFSEGWLAWGALLGNKNFALLAGAVCALILLLLQLRCTLTELRDRLEPAIMSAGVIILITAAGGAFGKMLARIGIADALGRATEDGALSGVGLILLAWGLASLMKMVQGSGTVAMITASAMMASLLSEGSLEAFHPVYIYAAVGFGSLVVSWMNDSAFWVICKMSGFTEKETLSTWTPLMGILGVLGLFQVLVLSQLLPLR